MALNHGILPKFKAYPVFHSVRLSRPMIFIYVNHSQNVPVVALRVIQYTPQLFAIGLCRSAVVYATVRGLTSFVYISSYIIWFMLNFPVTDLSNVIHIGVSPVYNLYNPSLHCRED